MRVHVLWCLDLYLALEMGVCLPTHPLLLMLYICQSVLLMRTQFTCLQPQQQSHLSETFPLLNMEQFYSNFNEVLMPSIATYCCPTGEGMLEHGLDRHEQLKLQAQKQGLLEGSSALELPACCNVDPADECGDDQEDLDALMY